MKVVILDVVSRKIMPKKKIRLSVKLENNIPAIFTLDIDKAISALSTSYNLNGQIQLTVKDKDLLSGQEPEKIEILWFDPEKEDKTNGTNEN